MPEIDPARLRKLLGDYRLAMELIDHGGLESLLTRLERMEEAVEIVKPWIRHDSEGRAYLNSPFISRRLDDLLAALEAAGAGEEKS